jgi:hypothetical protein
MRGLFGLVSLVIVLGIIAFAVQHQLRANRAADAAGLGVPASAPAIAGPGGAVDRSSVDRYKGKLDATLQQGADGRAAAADAAEAPPQR